MSAVRGAPSRRAWAGRSYAGSFAMLVLAILFFVLSAPAQAADRGIVDNRLEIGTGVDPALIPGLAQEIGRGGLGARWTRLLVHWDRLQPSAPGVSSADDADGDGYADSYVAELKAIVGALSANGVKVILTPTEVPVWASDRSLWTSGYSHAIAMNVGDPVVLREFGRLGAFLAGDLGGAYLECWNEPNTGGTFYPQTRPHDPEFGLRVYVKMLKAFHDGVKGADPYAVVIAGATAPRGTNDVYSTSPRTFATYLHDHGASRYFDAYSHHPYCWAAPDVPPPNYRLTVWLANLHVITDLFPTKDFYLTEFGYGTSSPALIGLTVSPAMQARYLRSAYAYAARRYPQVKALLWFMVQDLPVAPDRLGAYMGLSTVSGDRKPAWYAFAGGNRLSPTFPAHIRRGQPFAVSVTLSSRVVGAVGGQVLLLQRRASASAAWKTAAAATTAADGTCAFRVKQAGGTRWYRVVFSGVCESRASSLRAR